MSEQSGGPRTVGPKESVAVGVIAMGILTVMMPWALPLALEAWGASSDQYLALWGSNVLIGIVTVLSGISVWRLKDL